MEPREVGVTPLGAQLPETVDDGDGDDLVDRGATRGLGQSLNGGSLGQCRQGAEAGTGHRLRCVPVEPAHEDTQRGEDVILTITLRRL